MKIGVMSLSTCAVGTFNIFNGHYPVFLENHAVFALITGRPVRIRLRTPPSSPFKPRVPARRQNGAFLRGFPASQFPDFGLCGRSRILVAVFGASSPPPKIPFPAAVVQREVRPQWKPQFGLCTAVTRDGQLRGYSGLSPSASNCRLHSVGGSRSRSMLMPRGRRPSTAALTRFGARKASEKLR